MAAFDVDVFSGGMFVELVEEPPSDADSADEDAGAGASITGAGCAGELSLGALEPADPPERVLGVVEVP